MDKLGPLGRVEARGWGWEHKESGLSSWGQHGGESDERDTLIEGAIWGIGET